MKTLLRPADPILGPAAPLFVPYLLQSDLEVWLVKERSTKSGDFRFASVGGRRHRITVNAGLGQEHFLIILAHEVAHYLSFRKHSRRALPHGLEWKQEFSALLLRMLEAGCFSSELRPLILRHLRNPKASLSADRLLWRALHAEKLKEGFVMLEEIPQHATFELPDGRTFVKMEKRRTRYTCRELRSGRLYWVSAIASAKMLAS